MKRDFVRIEDNDTLVRDTKTQAVLNTDVSSLSLYKKNRDIRRNKDKRLEHVESELAEIKKLLQKMLGNNK